MAACTTRRIPSVRTSRTRFGTGPPLLHIVGDSATILVLKLMQEIAPDSIWRARRLRIEHTPTASTESNVESTHRLGVNVTPRAGAGQIRMWHRAGLTFAYGSDADPGNPFETLMHWTTAHDTSGPSGTRVPLSCSANSAYAEPGVNIRTASCRETMLADLAVLSRDIFTVPAQALPGTTSLLTLLGGRVVYDAGVLDPEVPR